MQTFTIDKNFAVTAGALDNARLNKQALEGWQIMMTLLALNPAGEHRRPSAWVNHPAVRMWRGHELALNEYVQVMVCEWLARGYKSTIGDKAMATAKRAIELRLVGKNAAKTPDWFNDEATRLSVETSHRSALLSKNYDWYSRLDWPEDDGVHHDTYEYIWPVDKEVKTLA